MAKKDFFQSLDKIVSDKIYLTERLDELDKEIQANHWSIGIDSDTAQLISNYDLQDYLRKVIQHRVKQLEDSNKKIGLLFYIWLDEQAGNLNFNFINSEHDRLPFGAKIEFVDSIDQIINDFLNSKYLDGIPWNELKDFSSDKGNNDEIEFKLKVYKEIIKNTKAQQAV